MRDENPIRTLGDYSKPSHEGYGDTIELPIGNNVVPLRSDTIQLVQNGCSFYGLLSEDPNQHLKDFLKLVDSLDLDSENRERMRLRLFQFSLRGQPSNWLESHLALTQPPQMKKSLPHVSSVVVPTTLCIAWKIPNKPLLNTHPRVSMKREDGKIAVGEGITRSVFRVKGVDLGEGEATYWITLGKRESYKPRPCSDGIGARTPYYTWKDFLDCHLPREWEVARDVKLNPFKDTLV
nr:zinc finger, CCHC-type [Tanacetum cinerariifolium]